MKPIVAPVNLKNAEYRRLGQMLSCLTLLCGLAEPSIAAGLPGGAGSLRESYENWEVTCVAGTPAPRCAMVQTLVDETSRQRVLAIEIRTASGGTAEGTLVLPFGLALANGVTLAYDAGTPGPSLAFSTCLPVGCVVPLAFDAAALKDLKRSVTLNVAAVAGDGGQPARFAVSLKGFSAAFARIAALLS